MCRAFLISASYDKQIRFWDAACGRTVRCFPFQDSQVNALLLVPDTTHLAVAGFGVVRVYDIATTGAGAAGGGVGGQTLPLFSSYENSSAMNMTSLGSFPVRLQKDAANQLNNFATMSNMNIFNKTGDFGSLTQATGGEHTQAVLATALYATSEDGHIRFFNASTPTVLQLIWDISTGAAITCSALSPDRQTLLTGSQIGRVSVWHLPTIIAVATKQQEGTTHASFGQTPLQEISFDADYTAIRSIAIEPLARWAVAATNAGKVHFLRFVKHSGSSESPTCRDNANDKRRTKDGGSEGAVGEDLATTQKADAADLSEGVSAASFSFAQDTNYMRVESVYRSALVSNDLGNTGLKSNALAASSTPCRNKASSDCEHNSNKSSDSKTIVNSGLRKEQLSSFRLESDNLFLQRLPHLKGCMMEVFHSFQAHYKYILKVAISPNSDLLVTCCADYTVGRFLIPPELQHADVTEYDNNEEKSHTSFGSCAVTKLPTVFSGDADDAGNSDAKNITKVGLSDISLAVSLPQQPITRGNTANPTNEKTESNETVGSGRAPSENLQKTTASLAESTVPQEVSKLMGNVGIDPTVIHDASSIPYSVMKSCTLERNTEQQCAKITQFTALKPLTGHTRWVWDCVFSDCGQFLFTASSDHNLRMWTSLLTDRVQSTCFNGHTKPVVSCILYYEKKPKE